MWGCPCGPGLAGQELQCAGHEICVELEYAAMTRIGINNQATVRKPARQVVRVERGDHAVMRPVDNEYGLLDNGKIGRLFLIPRAQRLQLCNVGSLR